MSASPAIRSTGIVVALASEASVLASRAVQPKRITPLADGAALCLSGMGPLPARHAAERLVKAGAPALAVFGVAGALAKELRNGMLFCPQHVRDEEGHRYEADCAWRAALKRRLAFPARTQGSLLSVASPLLTPAAKSAAHRRYAALAVDMESAAVAAVAQEHGLPFLVLRAIVDEDNDAMAEALIGSMDTFGRPRPLHLFAAFCRHPSLLGTLPRLYLRMRIAIQALRTAAAAGPNLGWHRP